MDRQTYHEDRLLILSLYKQFSFFMDCSYLNFYYLSPFYISVINMWRQMETGRLDRDSSLYWLLMEPILRGPWVRYCLGRGTTDV